jgi:hypothetical protein
MRPTAFVSEILAAGLPALVLALWWPSGYMMSRDSGCTEVRLARGKEICRALSDSMEWNWSGHAIISPGWRVTWQGVRHV